MASRTLHKLSAKSLSGNTKRGYYADGGGLYFRVSAFNTRSWAFRYTRSGKSREMGLGPHPDISLHEARKKAEDARRELRDQIDPINKRRAQRSAKAAQNAAALTFAQCTDAYIAKQEAGWKNAKHGNQWRNTLATYAYPVIGQVLISDIEQAHILRILEPIWTTKTETASRLRGRIENVLDYATVRGYRKGDNPARWRGHLDKLLAAPSKIVSPSHHTALPHTKIGALMERLREEIGINARALEFTILTIARSGEVRGATWDEIDMEGAVWTIPAHRMKAKREHRVPLPASTLKLLQGLPRIDGSPLLFPNTKGALLSDVALTNVLRRIGQTVSVHGFRSTFRDWAGETTAFAREVIEHALAHQLKDKAEAAYARGTLFDKRRRLMNEWGKYCHVASKTNAPAIPINQPRTAHK